MEFSKALTTALRSQKVPQHLPGPGGAGTKAAVMGVGVPYLGPFGRLGF